MKLGHVCEPGWPEEAGSEVGGSSPSPASPRTLHILATGEEWTAFCGQRGGASDGTSGRWGRRLESSHSSEALERSRPEGDQQRQTELAGLGLPVGMSPGLLPAAAELLLAGSCGGEGQKRSPQQGAAPRGWPKLRARGSGANRHQGRASRILDPQASGPLRGCEWAADSRDLPAEAKTLTNSEEK